jgi:hypothetical protein
VNYLVYLRVHGVHGSTPLNKIKAPKAAPALRYALSVAFRSPKATAQCANYLLALLVEREVVAQRKRERDACTEVKQMKVI